jgi:hypothetical protein
MLVEIILIVLVLILIWVINLKPPFPNDGKVGEDYIPKQKKWN